MSVDSQNDEFFCFKQKTTYEILISDWSSDVCSSDLPPPTARKKLSYKDHRDYDMLPSRIEAIEKEMAGIEGDLSDGGLFTRDHARFTALTGKLDKLREEKAAAEDRWLALAEEVETLS